MEQRIAEIRKGIERLKKLYENSALEATQLRLENTELRNKVAALEALGVSKSKQDVLHGIADSVKEVRDTKEMKQTINALVREVDKCIALLNQ